ncbi:MAG: molybdopterin molybdotransferase MoeA [Treponema sp.]|nr:molybdopterin molybdotransferase MoeA [Treponema sp.]
MKLLTVDTIDAAREKISGFTKSWELKSESVALGKAQGRIIACDVFAACDIPAFRRSTVDGYAVIARDTAGATDTIPVFLKQVGSVVMGRPADFTIRCGECAYVPTGGMFPAGADAAVMIEYCEDSGGGVIANGVVANGVIAVCDAVASGAGMVGIGEDFQNGKLLLKRGTVIRPQEIGALSAAGICTVNVFAPLALSIISTGDELVAPEKTPAPGEVRDVNTNALKALAEKHGYLVASTQVLADNEAQIEAAVRTAAQTSDIVIVSGGSSQGEKDFTAQIIGRIASPGVFTHGLALKPGKPTILGWDGNGKTLLAGLPGHPVSAMMVFELLFGWLAALRNKEAGIVGVLPPRHLQARISSNVPGAGGRAVCMPVALTPQISPNGEQCTYSAEPIFGKASMVSMLTQADGYIIINQNKEGLKKDEPVLVHLF